VENFVAHAVETQCPEISFYKLQNSIQTLKNTSPGNDLIANIFLSRSPDYIKMELLNLYKTSLVCRTVPTAWKQGVICPILKPGKDPSQEKCYRPVTLLSCIGKLMERIVQKRIEYHIGIYHALPPIQTGYHCGRSTIDLLAVLTHTSRRAAVDGRHWMGDTPWSII
jgi:hypothetical protein